MYRVEYSNVFCKTYKNDIKKVILNFKFTAKCKALLTELNLRGIHREL